MPCQEHWLKELGIDFDPRDVNVADLDQSRSLEHQTRSEPLNVQRVNRYATHMIAGAQFPAIICYRPEGQRRYVVLDGIARMAAAKAASRTTLPALILQGPTPPQVAEVLAESNERNGDPPTDEDRKRLAITLIEQANLTREEAARRVGLPAAIVEMEKAIQDTMRRVVNAGFKGHIPRSSFHRLFAVKNDKVLLGASELIRDAHLTQPAVNSLVTSLNKERTEAAQLAKLDSERKRLRPTITSAPGEEWPEVRRFMNACAYVGMSVDVDRLASLPLGKDRKKEILNLAKDATLILRAVARRLEKDGG